MPRGSSHPQNLSKDNGRQLIIVFFGVKIMKLLNISLNVSSVVLFTLLPVVNSNGIAEAGIVKGYIPPATGFFLQRTEGSGIRGRCAQSQNTYLKLLAPDNHIATTISERPSFLWYLEPTMLPVRFTLTETGQESPVIAQQIKIKQPGIIKFDLPAEVKLKVGKKYRWTVSLTCNEKRPSANTYASAVMERVEIPLKLKQRIGTNGEEKIDLYEETGIWYDALAARFQEWKEKPENKLVGVNFFKLLEQAGVSQEVAKDIMHSATLPE